MIISLGIDIVEIKRIQRSLKTYKGRFREKYFTNGEITYCASKKRPSEHYAARFAAKEAAFKALGEPWPYGTSHRDVEVVIDDHGKPSVMFSSNLNAAFKNKGMKNAFVSLTHTRETAAAVVIIEG